MASNTRLISGGTTYYLAGGGLAQIPYAGSATPWTLQTTTPFELSLNDITPTWTPVPAPSVPILGGGPPFRLGRSIIAKSYDTITEQVGIQMRATSLDNAVALLRMLRQILNTTLYDSPCILAVQPDGATNTTYFEILYADVPETPDYITENATGAAIFRATITWVRTIGSAGALTTLINAVTIENRSSGSPDNVESLGTLAGDLVNEGQPLNLKLVANASIDRMYMATVHERVAIACASTKTTTTINFFTVPTTAVITNARGRALKARFLARFDTFTNPAKIQLRARVTGAGTVTYTSPLLTLPAGAATTSTLLDFGVFDLSVLRSIFNATLAPVVLVDLLSSDGTSVTARLDYIEILLYRTFCLIPDTGLDGAFSLVVEQANDYNVNGVVTPSTPPRLYSVTTADGLLNAPISYRGMLPRAYAGASLWLGWLDNGASANISHTTTATLTATATHLPLFHTLRGSG
jgi:hypothetical protein